MAAVLLQARRSEARVCSASRRIFRVPANDAVELFFFEDGYAGVSAVGNGITNVCGLSRESTLKGFDFDYDALLDSNDALRERLTPLRREMEWLSVGPLKFENHFRGQPEPGVYRAGDALSFVDPFTGSGLLVAVRTGELAGTFAATGTSSAVYLRAARDLLGLPFILSSIVRMALQSGWVNRLTRLIPGPILFRLTRPEARVPDMLA